MTEFEILLTVMVVSYALLAVNPYGAFVFAVLGMNVNNSDELWILAFSATALSFLETLIVKGRSKSNF